MPKITIDGIPYEVEAGKNLLDTALSLGLDLPYFCWHPAMGSVGACRQCAVKQFKDENDTRGQIVMACMTPVAEGMLVSIKDPDAHEFRQNVIEWLMVNHPHDCPVCDEGGECHLQDMTLMTGHNYRRYRFTKRTHHNQYLGPFIHHEMNRCIACYRCVRYYRDFADGRDLDVFQAHDNVYFGRSEDGVLENEFSGNLVEVCPTGVFTDETLHRHYTRKWDLQTAPSVCHLCSVGCNTIPGERYGSLRRIRNRYNYNVNGYFLCDRGRYGYEFVNDQNRFRQPTGRSSSGQVEPLTLEALKQNWQEMQKVSTGLVGLGSPRASLEANYALRKLVGPDRFFGGVSRRTARIVDEVLKILKDGPTAAASLREVSEADVVLILGEDVTNTAPMAALAVRQASRNLPNMRATQLGIPSWNDHAVREIVQKDRGPLYIASYASTRLDDIATRTFHAGPEALALLGYAIGRALDAGASFSGTIEPEVQALADEIAGVLRSAENPLVISGTGAGSLELVRAAANIAWALGKQGKASRLYYALPEANSYGLGMMTHTGLEDALQALESGKADTLVVLENDLYHQANPQVVERILSAAKNVVVLDHLESKTTQSASLVLPAGTFAESDGTLINNEGRAQRFFQVFPPAGEVQESWRWLRDWMMATGQDDAQEWRGLDNVMWEMAAAMPALAPVVNVAPGEAFRIADAKIARKPRRYSGWTAMNANKSVHEPKPPDDPDTPFNFSMEGYNNQPPPALLNRYWAPGWNSVQALTKFQSEVNGPLEGGDPGLRLIEPVPGKAPTYFQPSAPFTPLPSGDLELVPFYHIFGTERLSMHAPGVAELAPEPYLALNPEDAFSLGLSKGNVASISAAGVDLLLPVQLDGSLARGLAGIPNGLPGVPWLDLPHRGITITLAAQEG